MLNEMENDESKYVMEETWKNERVLHFWCKSSPTSKQSRDKLRKEISTQILKERIAKDVFLKVMAKKYFDEYVELKLVYGIHKKRCNRKRNDIDNLIKHTLDSLKGILFSDDSQIKKVSATKFSLDQNRPECTGISIAKFKMN